MQDQEQETKELESGRCTGKKDDLNCLLKYGLLLMRISFILVQYLSLRAKNVYSLAMVTSETMGRGQKNCMMPQREKSAGCDSSV